MRQHHALGRARGAGCVKQDHGVVGFAGPVHKGIIGNRRGFGQQGAIMDRVGGQAVGRRVPIGENQVFQGGAQPHQVCCAVLKMAIHDQHGGGAIGDQVNHFRFGQAEIDRHRDGADHAGGEIGFDQPMRILAQKGNAPARFHAQIDQRLRHAMAAVIELCPSEIAPFKMQRAPVGRGRCVFADKIRKLDHFAPPVTERPTISRMISPVPPAIRPTRASAHARATGYSHI